MNRLRFTEWLIFALAGAAAIYGAAINRATDASLGLLHFATAPALIIIALTAVHAWARRTDVLGSTRYLSLFCAVLAAAIMLSGFYSRANPAYTWGEAVLGGLLLVVCIVEAWFSWPSSQSGVMRSNARPPA